METLFEHLRKPTVPDLAQIRSLYETCFPPAERKPFDTIQQRLQAGKYLCFVTRTSEEILAFGLLLPLPSLSATFLEYIAVAPSHQSQGVGGHLLQFIIDELKTTLVWEVEPSINNEATDIRNRRLRFYERLGARMIDLSTTYVMPDFEAREGGVPLRLMQLPLETQPNRETVNAIIREIYAVAYPDWLHLGEKIVMATELEV